mmetsp:Transcript_66751/g.118098  ORF Transcript_66751/g.118098 Transcript_66751/m.118098 type:complete len:627 (+) Transcript_66751:68-1948(+)
MLGTKSAGSGAAVPVVKVALAGQGGGYGGRSHGAAFDGRPASSGGTEKMRVTPCFAAGVMGTGLVEAQRRLGLRQPKTRPASAGRRSEERTLKLSEEQKEAADPGWLPEQKEELATLHVKLNLATAVIQVDASKDPDALKRPSSATSTRRGASSQRAASVKGKANIAVRSEAWLAYRRQKMEALREKCEADIGNFSPRLCKAVRSPRWLAGPEGGGSLHERGMRSIARKVVAKRRYEEEKLAEDLQRCPFTPKLTSSWPSSHAALEEAKKEALSPPKPLRAVVSASATDSERPSPDGHVTRQRAAVFYDRQKAWLEAKLEDQKQLREERVFQTLQDESMARKRECSPHGNAQARRGVLCRTVYDRQVAWQRQRDLELEEMRTAKFEEIMGRGSHSQRGSACSTPRRRSLSAPGSPRSAGWSDAPAEPPSYAWNAAPDGASRLYTRPPPWQHRSSSDSESLRGSGGGQGWRGAAGSLDGRGCSISVPSTPRANRPADEAAKDVLSGVAIVERLKNARQQSRHASPFGGSLPGAPGLWSRSAPATPRSARRSLQEDAPVDAGYLRENQADVDCLACGVIHLKGSNFCRHCGQRREQALQSDGAASSLDHTADFGWPGSAEEKSPQAIN